MTEPIDLTEPRHVHLVAVGGKAMSAMAELLVRMGHRVTGSDIHDGAEVDRLRQLGVRVTIGHDPANVQGAELVACSTAVPDNNVERVAATSAGIPVIGRPELQGAIASGHRVVAVSGTHGKSSVTAMLTTIVRHVGLDPSYLVGATMADGRGSAHLGAGEWFIIEGDESDGTFLRLGAEIAVVTNVAVDHLDQWGSIEALEAGFARFLNEAHGPTVVNADDPIASLLGRQHGSVSVGCTDDADWRITDIEERRGAISFALGRNGDPPINVTVSEPGAYNARNAALAVVTATLMGVDLDRAASALSQYQGLERRFQVVGEAAGVTVVDDYAHNPDKVAAVVDGASRGGWQRVVVVFQPHRYSRTADLWPMFANSFAGADTVVVTELDPSNEAPRPGVSGRLIADAVAGAHPELDVHWVPDRDLLIAAVAELTRPGDVVLFLGAGDITRLAPKLIEALTNDDLTYDDLTYDDAGGSS